MEGYREKYINGVNESDQEGERQTECYDGRAG